MENSTIQGNTAHRGGGIFSNRPVDISNSTIDGNNAHGVGGIELYDAPLVFAKVTVSYNTGAIGILLENIHNAEFTNVTISDNLGSGIWIHNSTVSLTNVTISNNAEYGAYNAPYPPPSVVMFKNTIVAHNPWGSCVGADVTSLGFNLDSGDTCGYATLGDISNADPMLVPLVNNGGQTETRALHLSSPAVDAGTNTGCPATDQRGYARPIDGDLNGSAICDIGAYEFKAFGLFLLIVKK